MMKGLFHKLCLQPSYSTAERKTREGIDP